MSESVSLGRKDFEEMKKEIRDIKESLAVLLDRELMDSAKRGLEDIKSGRVLSHEEVKRKFSC
jgi:predicted transcriptional regulator